MIKKLQPVKLTAEQLKDVRSQLGNQTTERRTPTSTDPDNFPVFETPVNKKVLIYVPNHTVVNADGVEELRMDKPFIHAVTDGKRFMYYRCTAGVSIAGTVFNGDCPMCEGCSEPWEFANLQIKEKCRQQGLDPEDTENKDVKSIRSSAFSDRVIKDATRYFTFPIVVIETLNDDGKTVVKDEKGGIKFRPMWYNISESMYADKWAKVLEGMEDEPTHPGGHFFLLNYTYVPKRGEPNKRDSARALVVTERKVKVSETFIKKLDSITEEWTPDKSAETVIRNQLYAPQDLEEVVDELLQNTRRMIALYQSKEAGMAAVGNGGDPFTLEEKPSKPEETDDASGISLDETDLDVG